MIDATVKAINKQFGDEAAHTLTDAYAPELVRGFIPTGNLAIDYVIGKPGIPLGRVTEIAGKPGSGKSSIVASMIGAAQKSGAVCVLIDAEHSYDSNWSRLHGVNPNELIYPEPPHLEGVFNMAIAAIKKIKEEQARYRSLSLSRVSPQHLQLPNWNRKILQQAGKTLLMQW